MKRRTIGLLILLLAVLGTGLFTIALLAQVPPAGTRIVNSAAATYYFEGRRYRVSSNEAEVYILPVYGVSITPDGTEPAPGQVQFLPPGATAGFAYTLCNTGNTDDSYDLSAIVGTNTFSPTNISIIWDKNGNGVSDPGEPAINHSPTLEMGECIPIVVTYHVSTSATAGDYAFVDLRGTSVGDGIKTDTNNINKTVITENAALRLTKSADPTSLRWGDYLTWRIVGKNLGSRPATGVTVTVDGASMSGILVSDPIPGYADGNRYVGGSLSGMPVGTTIYSTDGATTWTETAPSASAIDAVGYLFPGLDPGQEFALTYQIKVRSPAGLLVNTASAFYMDTTGTKREATAQATAFIQDPDPVIGPWEYPLGDAPGDTYPSGSGLTMTRTDDLTETPYVYVGDSADFVNTIRNIGNVPQPINVSVDPSSNLPAGYTVTFSYYGGGPLADTNGDGIADVGTVLPGEEVSILVEVQVPLDAELGDNDGEYWNAVIRIAGAIDPDLFDLTTDRIKEIRGYWRLKKDVNYDTARYGDLLTYTLSFENTSQYPIEDVVITDRLDRGLQSPDFIESGQISNENGSGSITVSATFDQTDHSITWEVTSPGGVVPAGFKGTLSFKARVVIEESELEHTSPVPMVRNFFSAIGDVTLPGGATRHLFQVSNRVATIIGVQGFLRIQKSVDRDRVVTGDVVTYTLTLANNHPDLPVQDLTVSDVLPPGLRYVEGTTTIDGVAYPDPAVSSDGRTLVWTINSIGASSTRLLRFHAAIMAEAPDMAINTGYVDGYYHTTDPETGDPYVLYAADGPATATIFIGGGFLGERTVLIGRVFNDCDGDCYQDPCEQGIAGVRVLLADGSFAVTDEHGMYHLVGIRPGVHIVRADPETMPSNCCLSKGSRLIEAISGGPVLRADFHCSCTQPSGDVQPGSTISPTASPEITVPDFPATRIGQVFLLPPAGAVFAQRDKISVMVETELSDLVDLYVNGQLLPRSQIGTRMYSPMARRARYVYVSVPLRAGENALELVGKNPKTGVFSVKRTVFLSGQAAHISLTYDRAAAIADGTSEFPLTIRVVDRLGNPAMAGAFVTVKVDGAEIASPDANPHVTGWQGLIGPDGAKMRVGPVLAPRTVTINVESGELSKKVEIPFSPAVRDWIIVGEGDLALGVPWSTAGDWRDHLPAVQSASLPFYSGEYWRSGHAALWGQGRVGAFGMLTFAVDTSHPILGPDDSPRYPQVWNDNAPIGRSANSSWRGFARLDTRSGAFAVLGDFKVDLSDAILYSYSRRFTGLRAQFGSANGVLVDLFAAETAQAWARDTIQGGDVCGPYELSDAPIKDRSEQVWVETRDSSGDPIDTTKKTRGTDYWIDYARGVITFSEAIASQDEAGNPKYIVVTYEVASRAFAEQDFPITGCILGPYTLSHVPLSPGSEEVTIEHRDPITNTLMATDELSPVTDYTMDYNNGKLMLTTAYCPTDSGGNSQVIHVEYRTTKPTPRFPVVGGRVSYSSGPLTGDLGFIYHGMAGFLEPFSLFDSGITYSGDFGSLTVRAASNGAPKADDIAVGVDMEIGVIPSWNIDGSYRYTGASFLKPDAASATDTASVGQGHTISLAGRGTIGSLTHTESISADFIAGSWSQGIAGSLPIGPGKGSLGLDWRSTGDPALVTELGYEATILGAYTKIWGKRAVGEDWSSFGAQFARGPLSGDFTQTLDPAASASEVQYNVSVDLGLGLSASVGQQHKSTGGTETSTFTWKFSADFVVPGGINLSGSFAGTSPNSGTETYDFHLSGEKEMSDPRDVLSFSARLGSEKPTLKGMDVKLVLRSPREWDTWGQVCATADSVLGRVDYAFRPIAWPWISCIGQAEVQAKDGNMSLAGSVDGIWHPPNGMDLSVKWALRTATHFDAGANTATLVDLERIQLLWPIAGTRWQAGGYLGLSHDFTGGSTTHIAGIQARCFMTEDLALVLGMNLVGLDYPAFEANQYEYVGPFIRLEAKTEGGLPW